MKIISTKLEDILDIHEKYSKYKKNVKTKTLLLLSTLLLSYSIYNNNYYSKHFQNNYLKNNKIIQSNKTQQKKEIKKKKSLENNIQKYLHNISQLSDFQLSSYHLEYKKKLESKYLENIIETANTFEIPSNLFRSLLIKEHGLGKVSPTGAKGPGQLFPQAVKDSLRYIYTNKITKSHLYDESQNYFKTKNKILKKRIIKNIIDDNIKNIEASGAYLRYLKNIFVDWSLSVSAYQAGIKNIAYLVWFHKGAKTKKWWPKFVNKKSINVKEIQKYVKNNNISINDLLNCEALLNKYEKIKKKNKYLRVESYTPDVFKIAYTTNS